MIFSTLYNPSIDLIYTVDELRLGNTYTKLPSLMYPAGKGLNFAKAVKELGEEVTLCAIMPENDERRFSNYLNELEIPYKFFLIEGCARINTTLLENSTKMVTHFNSLGSRGSTRIQDKFEMFIEEIMIEDDLWVFSGSIPTNMDDDSYSKIIEYANARNVRCALDTSGVPLKYGIQAKPLILSPNQSELENITDEPVDGIRHLALKGKRLVDAGIPYVFITLGEDGVIALNKETCLLCTPPAVEVVDTVGCGDSFLAGVVVGMERGFNFHETCRIAVAAGTSNAMHKGPGEIEQDQVWALMEDVVVNSI